MLPDEEREEQREHDHQQDQGEQASQKVDAARHRRVSCVSD